jgi:ADP-ribose pyrophosphatase YjhB (NUDIX family)
MSTEEAPFPIRPTARVLLLDNQDRILLMKGRLPGDSGPGAWFTVGGAVEGDETFVQAAAREVCEETGLDAFELGPVVWVREGVLNIPRPTYFKETYLIARCAGGEPSREGWTRQEHAWIDAMRWWTMDELAATVEPVFPPGLALLLPALLAGFLPTEPVSIPW